MGMGDVYNTDGLPIGEYPLKIVDFMTKQSSTGTNWLKLKVMEPERRTGWIDFPITEKAIGRFIGFLKALGMSKEEISAYEARPWIKGYAETNHAILVGRCFLGRIDHKDGGYPDLRASKALQAAFPEVEPEPEPAAAAPSGNYVMPRSVERDPVASDDNDLPF